uniref:Uncharacterized protein n=1 Tax=Chromera velia CCMP2878 TaxID=1169474 RepID=A0A0G4IDR0_9ALVE|eukprot:Cvel_2341.t1-p1 / transcript=Cvel_2341.t1 / gene=Cvel_2341 / organism=Chromera_velia_CCMP2878 / gene_product=hypothetical protein / transcript_product=hypothetical protein / location=Cvel_scaffold90:127759-134331(+) / protein_length=617 / sequence_SO=supercontig / SO=protein_coding / is_pseudo=false
MRGNGVTGGHWGLGRWPVVGVDYKEALEWVDLRDGEAFSRLLEKTLEPSAPLPEVEEGSVVRPLVYDTFTEQLEQASLDPDCKGSLVLLTTFDCPVCGLAKDFLRVSGSLPPLNTGTVRLYSYDLSSNCYPPGVPREIIAGTPTYLFVYPKGLRKKKSAAPAPLEPEKGLSLAGPRLGGVPLAAGKGEKGGDLGESSSGSGSGTVTATVTVDTGDEDEHEKAKEMELDRRILRFARTRGEVPVSFVETPFSGLTGSDEPVGAGVQFRSADAQVSAGEQKDKGGSQTRPESSDGPSFSSSASSSGLAAFSANTAVFEELPLFEFLRMSPDTFRAAVEGRGKKDRKENNGATSGEKDTSLDRVEREGDEDEDLRRLIELMEREGAAEEEKVGGQAAVPESTGTHDLPSEKDQMLPVGRVSSGKRMEEQQSGVERDDSRRRGDGNDPMDAPERGGQQPRDEGERDLSIENVDTKHTVSDSSSSTHPSSSSSSSSAHGVEALSSLSALSVCLFLALPFCWYQLEGLKRERAETLRQIVEVLQSEDLVDAFTAKGLYETMEKATEISEDEVKREIGVSMKDGKVASYMRGLLEHRNRLRRQVAFLQYFLREAPQAAEEFQKG